MKTDDLLQILIKGQDALQKGLDALQKGHSELKEELVVLREELTVLKKETMDGFRKTHERLDKQGKLIISTRKTF